MEGYQTYMAQVAEVSVQNGDIKVHKVTVAVDLGRMVNPNIVQQQLESNIVFGLTALLYGDITLKGGQVEQKNFDTYKLLRINEMPKIDMHIVKSTENPGGIGEPGMALISPAVANAVFTLTGKRLRSMPLRLA
jgi:isoquinoline 1-oxidoreductase beta subunit